MKTAEFLNYTPPDLLGGKEVKGKCFGVELELEGVNVRLRDVATRGWQRHDDGSLRGESVEYITAGAKELGECQKLVTDLFKKFKDNGVVFNNSIRTSTHVHLNFSDKPLKQAINFFCLFTLLEEVLGYYSGEDRKGNLFCVSTREGEGIVGVLSEALATGNLHRFAGDRYKYAACNLSTLYKFGTVEVRTMRGASSAEQVNKWLDILNDMYEYSIKMVSPADLIVNLSYLGSDGLMRSIFKGDNYKELMSSFPKVRVLNDSLMEGARILQVFAYEFDDAFKEKVEIKKMPKGSLPLMIQRGPFRGHHYSVYRPDGQRWSLMPHRGLLPDAHATHWKDGQKVSDCQSMEWSEAHGRFIVRYPNGEIYECNWARHEVYGNEGPPAHPFRRMPNDRVQEEEVEDWPEPVFDDEDEGGF